MYDNPAEIWNVFSGTIVRSSLLKVLEYEREYICLKCKKTFLVEADFHQFYKIVLPPSCPTEKCKSNTFIATNISG